MLAMQVHINHYLLNATINRNKFERQYCPTLLVADLSPSHSECEQIGQVICFKLCH